MVDENGNCVEFRTTEFDRKVILVTNIFTLSVTNHTNFKWQSTSSRTYGVLHIRSGPNVLMKLAMIFFEGNAHFS